MAEQNPDQNIDKTDSKKKLPLKTLMVIAGVVLMEIATIGTVWFMRGGQPSPAQASNPIEQTQAAAAKQLAEVVVASGSFDNHIGGRAKMIVNLEVAAKVEQEKQADLESQIKLHGKEIMNMVREVISSVQPTELKDPKLQVVKRELLIGLEGIIDKDLVSEILISEWQTYVSE